MSFSLPWYFIIGMVITFVAGIWAGWEGAKHTLQEIAEALAVTAEAIKDNNLTREEIEKIIDEWRDVVVAALNVIRK